MEQDSAKPTENWRVFGIGFNKTGTTSLKGCFHILGFGPVAPNSRQCPQKKTITAALLENEDYEPALEFAENYRSFEDRPWNVWEMYQHLDRRFPASRFILTYRDPESWWRSVERWLTVVKPGRMPEKYRRHLRSPTLEKAEMVAGYLRYCDQVKEYFKGRDDFLAIDFEAGEGWEPLCEFLDVPVPEEPFPHANKMTYDDRDLERRKRKPSIRKKVQRYLGTNRSRFKSETGPSSPCAICSQPLFLPRNQLNLFSMGNGGWLRNGVSRGQRLLFQRSMAKAQKEPAVDLTSRTGIDDLAAVTWYFNPHQDPLLLDNFRDFRAAMQKVPVPVLIVELALGNAAHQLGADFGEVVRMRTPDLMWQKERLLNKGIGILLDRGYEKIAWLDPEVRFIADESWPWLIAAELERSRLCQAFSQALIHTPGSVIWPGVSGVKYFRDTGALLDQAGLAPGWRHLTGYPPGFSGYAWAARAEVLNEVKLYDTAVTGGADQMILAASLLEEPHKDRCVLKITNTPFRKCAHCCSHKKAVAYTYHYLNWTERWSKAVSGKVGFVKQGINVINSHHVDSRQRLYAKNILVRNNFRPLDDIRQGADGSWLWNSGKRVLHEDVRRHFTPQEENG